MTIPQTPPEQEIPVPREPGGDDVPGGPTPDLPPESPPERMPDWPPDTGEPPMRAPGENPDVETEL